MKNKKRKCAACWYELVRINKITENSESNWNCYRANSSSTRCLANNLILFNIGAWFSNLSFFVFSFPFYFSFVIIDETGSFTPVLSPTLLSFVQDRVKLFFVGIGRIETIEKEAWEREREKTLCLNDYQKHLQLFTHRWPNVRASLRVLCSSLRSRIHTKSEPPCTGETSKRQSIPNPLSGEYSIKTGSKLRESPISRFAIDRGEKSGARRRAAIVPATAGKRIDKGKWTWEESEAGEGRKRRRGSKSTKRAFRLILPHPPRRHPITPSLGHLLPISPFWSTAIR